MNILHVSQNYYPSVGGPQYTMKHLSEKMVSQYHDVVEVCTTNSMYGPETKLFKKITPAIENVDAVQVHRLPFNRWHYPIIDITNKVHAKATGRLLPHSVLKYRWNLDSPAMDKMMANSNADVIMATTILYNFADYPLWRHKTRKPKPFVLYGAVHLHKELPANSPDITRAKACDCYIANTDFEREKMIEYGVKPNNIVTVGTGIQLQDFEVDESTVQTFKKANGINNEDVVIGYIGRLVKGKGVAILIDAFRKLYAANNKVKLLLAGGTTDYVPQIKKVIDEEKLPIILLENFDEKEKAVIYHSLDVFVLASQSESFGVVFLEAWACKKPVIGTRLGAIESLLSAGVDSLLFNAGDETHLTHQIQRLIDDQDLRIQLGEAGYKKVKQNFTWEVVVSRYRQCYQQAIEQF